MASHYHHHLLRNNEYPMNKQTKEKHINKKTTTIFIDRRRIFFVPDFNVFSFSTKISSNSMMIAFFIIEKNCRTICLGSVFRIPSMIFFWN